MTSVSIDEPIGFSDFYTRSETVFMALIFAIFCVDVAISIGLNRPVEWAGFGIGAGACVGLIAIGSYARVAKGMDRAAKFLLAVGLKSLFGVMMGIFFHLQMPRPEPVLTEVLLQIDHWFGYHWPAMVEWAAGYNGLGQFLRIVYLSSVAQIMVVMATLAYKRRTRDLDAMIYANAIALILVYLVWQLFPNLSQSTYLTVAPEAERATNLITNSNYGAKLLAMAQTGLNPLRAQDMLGTVAFPSYHMVLVVLVMVFARRTVLFWPLAVLNVLMMPAILIHGAHHIADVVGGAAALMAALVPSYMLVNRLHDQTANRR